MKKALVPTTLTIALLLFGAHGMASETVDSSPSLEAAALEKRIEARMKAVVEGDWGAVYPFLDPEYRKAVTKEAFLQQPRNVKVEDYRIESMEVAPAGDSADARLRLTIKVQGFQFPNAPQNEQWVKESGEWFLKQEPKKAPPFPSTRPAKAENAEAQ